MKKVHVFNAGPCLLPQVAIDNTIEALKDFSGTGMSVLCVSHRTKEWDAVMDECRALWKELLHIPDTHEVVFLGGGASLQFLYVAMNFLEKKAAYLDTGVWASKALKEAKGLGDAYAIASSKDKNYTYIPKGFEVPADLDYLHIPTNNTIYGTEIHADLDVPCPLIAAMYSDPMSRPVGVSSAGVYIQNRTTRTSTSRARSSPTCPPTSCPVRWTSPSMTSSTAARRRTSAPPASSSPSSARTPWAA